MYPTTIGSAPHAVEARRSRRRLFIDELRKAGYFVALADGKTDFNFDPPKGWVDSTQNWTKKPEVLKAAVLRVHQPVVTHESQSAGDARRSTTKNTARLKPAERHDPAKVKLPPYYPDTPDGRATASARYHDNVTAMDYTVGDVLKLLDDQKLGDNTVVFFFGDHGWGLTAGKRWPYDSGLACPFLVRWPGKIKPGSVREDLVASSTSPRPC